MLVSNFSNDEIARLKAVFRGIHKSLRGVLLLAVMMPLSAAQCSSCEPDTRPHTASIIQPQVGNAMLFVPGELLEKRLDKK